MNRIFRLVWNRALRLLQVSSELTRAPRGQATGAGTGTVRRNGLAMACRLALGVVAMSALWAAPPLAAQSISHATGGSGDTPNGGGNGGDAGQPGADGSNGTGGAGGVTPGADGGDGLDTGGGGGGAHGGVLTVDPVADMTGGNGGNGDTGVVVGGGGGGGGGGDGALIGQDVNLSIGSGIWLRGGSGGLGFYRGGGGGGGAGLYVGGADVTAQLRVDGAIAGGAGGESSDLGGGGGAGVVVADGATLKLDLAGRIVGGSGGLAFSDGSSGDGIVASADSSVDVTLEQGAEIAGGAGVATGDGGAGLRLSGGGTITNQGGTISGGTTESWSSGGSGGAMTGGNGSGGAAGGTSEGQEGDAGAGIVGQGLTIINAGTIAGGTDPDGVHANAITFTGGTNSLMLRSGSVINGVVDATAGTLDGLILGDIDGTDMTFDIGQIGPVAQYRGFEQYWAVGNGTVTLTGTTMEVTPWTSDSDAVLSIASDASLGDQSGDLLLRYGGTLEVTGTANETTARNIGIYQQGHIDVIDADNRFSLTGAVTDFDPGIGGVDAPHSVLTKRGEGTLTLAGNNTYTGGTVVEGGTLEIAAGSTSGSLEGQDGLPGGVVQLGGGTTLHNAGAVGTVKFTSQQGMPTATDPLSITVTNAGSVVGDDLGVGVALFNGEISNSGSISVANQITVLGGGVVMVGEGSIDNSGSISAPQSLGLLLGTPLTTPTPITGSIELSNHQGGSIQGSVGVFVNQIVTLVSGATPTYSSRPIAIDNDGGSISGSLIGVELLGGGTVINQAGSLIETTGTTAGACALFLPGMSTPGGGSCAIFAPDLADVGAPPGLALPHTVLTNAGRIVGNVQLSDGLANEVTLVAGGAIDGNLDIGGSTDASLALQGDAGTTQAYSQAVTGDTTFAGKLTKSGAGTWVLDNAALAGATGTAQLQGGSLIVGGVAGDGGALGGNVAVASGATLGGHGTVAGNVTVAQDGTLSPGHSIGQLTIGGDLTLAAGSVLDIELGAPKPDFQAFGAGDAVTVNGDLSINGATLDISDAGGMGPGLYNVLNWGGTLSQGGSGLALGATPAGSSFVVQTLLGAKQINLIQTGGLVLNAWNANGLADATRMGGGSGIWSAVSPMWTDANGTAPNGAMAPQPGFALFGGDAGTVTVDNGTGAVGATGMQFAVDGYTLDGGSLSLVQDADGDAPIIRVGDGTTASASTTATIDAVLAGTDGLVKSDYGTLVLAGTNTFTGGLKVDGGTLSVADDANLGDASNGLILDGGVLEVTGATFTSTARDIALGNAGGGFAIDEAGTAFAVASSLDGAGALVKRGAGSLVLAGDNTYAGGTTIEAGRLQVGDGGISGSITGNVANSGALVFDRSDDVGFAGVVSGNGALVQQGSGTLTLAGNNTYAGGTTIAAGTLQIGDGGTAGSITGDVANNGALVFDRSDDVSFAGVISGSGSITQQGSNTLTLTGNNSYTGGTTIAAGTLQVGDGGAAGSITGDVVNNGALVFDRSDDADVIGVISGAGSLTQQGGGTLTLTGANTYSGGTTVAAGTLQVGNGGTAGSITGDVVNEGRLVLDRSDDVDFAGVISGAGSLMQQGSGTLILTGNNSYTGGTTIAGGSLQIGHGGTAGSITGDVVNDGTLVFDRSNDVAFGGVLSGNGTLTQQGDGVLTLDGASGTFAGSTAVRSGGLLIGSAGGNGAALGGDVIVDGAAMLGGHGNIGGDVEVRSGAHLDPGSAAAAIGTLTIGGDLTLAAGSELDFDLGAPLANFQAFGAGDNVAVGGDLALGGSVLNVSDAGGMGPGLYNVFSWGGTLVGSGDDIVLGAVPAGTNLQLQTLSAQKQINLIENSGFVLDVWNANGKADATRMGGGDGRWSTVSANWTDADGTTPNAAMQPQPGFALFGGDAGTVTVDNIAGNVSATGMQFAVDGYRLAGDTLTLVHDANGDAPIIRVGDGRAAGASTKATVDAVLAGTDGLVKADYGTLVLTGDNTYGGGTTIAAGTLQLGDGGSSGSIVGDIDNRGALAFDRSDDAGFAGVVSGNGLLVQQGSGTLTLSGDNTYAGGTAIAAGTLQVGEGGTAGSIVGDVANDGALVFDRSDAVNFGGVVSGTGALVQAGSGSLTLTGTNTYAGGTTIAAGRLVGDTRSLQGAIDNRGALVFAQAEDGRFDGSLSGNGSLAKTGQGELILNGDNHAFTGATSIQEGALIVGDDGFADASLGGMVTVGKGGLIGGFGTVGGLDLAGTLATGHSIGTLHVAGDGTFQAGSIWQIEVDPDGNSDRLDVAGKASIKGGSALALGAGDGWKAQTDYVVLDASGGVDGRFDEISTNLAFLTPTLIYAADSVTLSLARNQVDFGDVAHTPNQTGVADAIDDRGPGHAAYDAIVDMDGDDARDAFDQLSGELYAGMQSARLDDSRYVREAMDQRLTQADTGAASASTASLGGTAGTIWFHGWGQWGDRDGDGNAARMQSNGSGMLVGVDADLDGRARIGGLLGSSQSSIRVGERFSDGHDKATWAGLYGSASTGPVQWRAGLAYARERLDSHRHLTVPGLAGSVGADLHGRTEQGWVEAAMPHVTGRGRIDPFLNLAHVRVHSDSWSESGGGAALRGAAGDAKASLATLGVRGAWNLGSVELPIRLHGSLGWRQAFGNDAPQTRMTLDGSAPFTVYGLPLARHAVAVQAGLDFAVSGKVSVDLGYSGQFAGDARDQGARVTVRVGL